MGTEFCMVVANIYGLSVWNFMSLFWCLEFLSGTQSLSLIKLFYDRTSNLCGSSKIVSLHEHIVFRGMHENVCLHEYEIMSLFDSGGISHVMLCSRFLIYVKHTCKLKMYFCGVQKLNKTLKNYLFKEIKYLRIYKKD